MSRSMSLFLATALLSVACVGCMERQHGVRLSKDGRSEEVKKQAEIPFKVDNWHGRLLNAPDGDPVKRRSACVAIIRNADNPNMTGEMKAQLIDALKKMIEAEPKSDASDQMKEAIIQEGHRALAVLEGNNTSTATTSN